jgi:transcriptional antiterminator NusG
VIEKAHNSSQPLPEEAALELHPHPLATNTGLGEPGQEPQRAEAGHVHASDATAAEGGAHEVRSRDEAGHEAAPSDAHLEASAEVEAVEPTHAGPESQQETAAEAEEPERGPIEEIPLVDEPPKMDWYILKVQSNREDSIRESLKRRVAVAGLDRYFGEVIVPVEMVSEFKGGKKRVVKRKLYPGYLVVNMEINEDTWFLVRETPGIGDFTGSAGKPTPMLPHEVSKIVAKQEEKADEAPKLKINFNVGDRVKINEGTFDNFEGEVDSIDEASGRVTVMINIFGRSTPVELEYWQIEAI